MNPGHGDVEGNGRHEIVALDTSGPPVTRVRLMSDVTAYLWQLREISVFE
jgi:hypothetical protein